MSDRFHIEHPLGPADVVYDSFVDPERDHGTVIPDGWQAGRAEWFIRGAEYEHERILDLLESTLESGQDLTIEGVIALITTEPS